MKEEITAVQKLINTAIEFFVNYSLQVFGAIIVLIIGGLIAGWMSNLFLSFLRKKNVDITLAKFLASGLRILILGFAVLIALGKFGITIAPFIAALSAMAFGASFAIRGPLSNYGSGLSIILSRPFAVGSTICVKEVSGVVQDIKLAYTKLMTEDGVEITIPNNQIVGEVVHNSKENRIVEGDVGISYESDPEQAISVVRKSVESITGVAKMPAPQIGIQEFGDSSICIGYRYWAPTIKYYQTLYQVNLAVYKALQAAKINIPFPQREIRMISEQSKI